MLQVGATGIEHEEEEKYINGLVTGINKISKGVAYLDNIMGMQFKTLNFSNLVGFEVLTAVCYTRTYSVLKVNRRV
jgi:hypothetical protein